MTDSSELTRIALALPETTESTHFGRSSFRVRDKGFVGMLTDTRVGWQLDPALVPGLVADSPGLESLRRFDKVIGIEAELADVDVDQVERLTVLAWRHRAPKRLVKATFPDDS